MSDQETKRKPKYTIKNLSKEGEIYEISFIQKSSEDVQLKQIEVIEPLGDTKHEDIFVEKSIILEPVEPDNESKVIYEEPVKSKQRGIFYNVIGKYFLCC